MSPSASSIPTENSLTRRRWIDRILIAAGTGGFILFALHLLVSAFCAFSWQNFLMMDYGAYSNFLYNLAHGDGFRFLSDQSYLKTHLSFSFWLLTPLVHLWDSPLLLIVVQWLFLVSGCGILWKALRRGNVSPPLSMALLFCYVAYPMTQSVLMSEFHGVSAYLLLMPWIFHTAAYQKKWAFLPVLILLGLREDAGLLILPMLLYFSFRDRWKGGWILASISLAYVLLAITVLYPWINGISLLGVRAAEASSGSILHSFSGGHWADRLQAVFWLGLPAALLGLLLRNGWRALVVFPSVAFLVNISSAMHRQHGFDFHYPAAATSLLMCAMVWTASVRRRRPRRLSSTSLQQIAALALILATVIAHTQRGYFLGGGKGERTYTRMHPQMFPLLRLADHTPADGLLLCNQRLAPYFAMRPDIMVLHYFNPGQHTPEWIVTDLHELQTPDFAGVVASIENGEFGVYARQFPFVLLQRDVESDQTPALLESLEQHQMVPAFMLSQAGKVLDDAAHGLVKRWNPSGTGEQGLLAFGRAVHLPAGAYIASFDLRGPAVSSTPEGETGILSVHLKNQPESFGAMELRSGPADSFMAQEISFHLSEPAEVEPRITGGGFPFEARGIRIRPLAAPVPPEPNR